MVAPSIRKQDEYQAFYTNCNHITNYMASLLDCQDGMSVLEPCAGDGAFIDELIKNGKKINVTALDLSLSSIKKLQNKYRGLNNISVYESDFALSDSIGFYERIIANPPYGAYQTPLKRKLLKDKYPDIYAKETYGVFLIRALEKLKPSGRLVFIVPDTFLTLHNHEGLRKRLLNDCKVESITLFPSNFFPGVNFGYAGLSILSVLNEPAPSDWSFPVISGLKSNINFIDISNCNHHEFNVSRLSCQQVMKNSSYSFYLPSEEWVSNVLDSNLSIVGDICDVVTGFYSGNDALYLRRANSVTRGIKKYLEIDAEQINLESFAMNPPLEGISGERHWVPIVKGGNRRLFKPSEWFMNWSISSVYDYKVLNKKKARFQNSQYYFKQGIAVPMVSSTAITGALIEERLFDQSIVGIFPKYGHHHLLYYLLGFFNSKVCEKLIRTINASTNNSSNYIKKIPLVLPDSETLNSINNLVSGLYNLAKIREVVEYDLEEMNNIFDTIYKEKIVSVKSNLLSKTLTFSS